MARVARDTHDCGFCNNASEKSADDVLNRWWWLNNSVNRLTVEGRPQQAATDRRIRDLRCLTIELVMSTLVRTYLMSSIITSCNR